MPVTQSEMQKFMERVRAENIPADRANVELVKMERVRLVTGKLPAQVRKALNAAVKSGELAHVTRDGNKPEAYFHPSFDYLMKEARSAHAYSVVRAVAACTGVNLDLEG